MLLSVIEYVPMVLSYSAVGLSNKSKFSTVLEDFDCRNKLLNDVMELQEFLKQRNLETASEGGDPGLLMISGSLPEALQAYSSEEVSVMIANTQLVVDKMTEKKLQHILLILDSPRYQSNSYTCM